MTPSSSEHAGTTTDRVRAECSTTRAPQSEMMWRTSSAVSRVDTGV